MVLRNSQKFGLFYGCARYPDCNATHGAYSDGKPLGIPANKETKNARIKAHSAFDELWKDKRNKGALNARSDAYKWLAEKLGITPEECHIGRFNIEMCKRVMEICEHEKKLRLMARSVY